MLWMHSHARSLNISYNISFQDVFWMFLFLNKKNNEKNFILRINEAVFASEYNVNWWRRLNIEIYIRIVFSPCLMLIFCRRKGILFHNLSWKTFTNGVYKALNYYPLHLLSKDIVKKMSKVVEFFFLWRSKRRFDSRQVSGAIHGTILYPYPPFSEP